MAFKLRLSLHTMILHCCIRILVMIQFVPDAIVPLVIVCAAELMSQVMPSPERLVSTQSKMLVCGKLAHNIRIQALNSRLFGRRR